MSLKLSVRKWVPEEEAIVKKKDNSSSCVSYFVTWALGIPLRFLSEVLHSTEVRFCVFSSIWEAVI